MSSDEPAYDILRSAVAEGRVEEVVVAVPDLQGRLQGSRLSAEYFLDQVAAEGYGACVYLLATDVEMDTGPGYAIDAWESGFGDLVLHPDPTTLRFPPWDPGTAQFVADARWPGGEPVGVAPRQVLSEQLNRLDDLGLRAYVGTELEFLVFQSTYQDAWERAYRGLRPATRHSADYSLQGLSTIEPVVRRIRREMVGAGLRLETARGEVHPGQYEIVFRYAEALETCDNHVLFKNGAKQIAAEEGHALTFMPKFDEGEGNSCHLHLSLRGRDGSAVFSAEEDPTEMSPLMRQFVAGQSVAMADFMLLMAPGVNSYKRLRPGAFAPTGVSWGRDNRTCPLRVVGHGPSLRVEHRVPGGDANPYLAVAAALGAGLYGIDNGLELGPPHTSNALADPDVPQLPRTLTQALHRWENSELAEKTFGPEVVAHYARAARAELDAFEGSVTDWERFRGFERL